MVEAAVQFVHRVMLPIELGAQMAAQVVRTVGLAEREVAGQQLRAATGPRAKSAAQAGVRLAAIQVGGAETMVCRRRLAQWAVCEIPRDSAGDSTLPAAAAGGAEAHPLSGASDLAAEGVAEAPRRLFRPHPCPPVCSRFHLGPGQVAETRSPCHRTCLILQ